MTYAQDRLIRDADSHLMELTDFLSRSAPQKIRNQLPSLDHVQLQGIGERMKQLHYGAGHDPDTLHELMSLGDRLTRGPKWLDALGSFHGPERGLALDLLGFQKQVVFSSFCATLIFNSEDPKLAYETADAHNRSMAEFCEADERLIGVAILPFDDKARAQSGLKTALNLGLGAIWIPSRAPGGRSPGHPANDWFWRSLEERQIPFILHVGSSQLAIPDPWMNDGVENRASARGGAEVIGSKDLTVIFQSAQRFISVFVLDGVLEKFRNLKGGVIELGAGWVPDTIRRLDYAVDIWARSEPHLATFQRRPSEQFQDQLRFTPYPFEPVGRLVEESNEDLYMFSSDYPHAEGGRDPIGRFSRSLEGHSEQVKEKFFCKNFDALYVT